MARKSQERAGEEEGCCWTAKSVHGRDVCNRDSKYQLDHRCDAHHDVHHLCQAVKVCQCANQQGLIGADHAMHTDLGQGRGQGSRAHVRDVACGQPEGVLADAGNAREVHDGEAEQGEQEDGEGCMG